MHSCRLPVNARMQIMCRKALTRRSSLSRAERRQPAGAGKEVAGGRGAETDVAQAACHQHAVDGAQPRGARPGCLGETFGLDGYAVSPLPLKIKIGWIAGAVHQEGEPNDRTWAVFPHLAVSGHRPPDRQHGNGLVQRWRNFPFHSRIGGFGKPGRLQEVSTGGCNSDAGYPRRDRLMVPDGHADKPPLWVVPPSGYYGFRAQRLPSHACAVVLGEASRVNSGRGSGNKCQEGDDECSVRLPVSAHDTPSTARSAAVTTLHRRT